MRTPTREEIDAIFKDLPDREKAMEDEMRALWAVVKESEPAMGVARSFAHTLYSALTASGINPKPIASVMMYGWILGQRYAEKQPQLPSGSDDWFKQLEADMKDPL